MSSSNHTRSLQSSSTETSNGTLHIVNSQNDSHKVTKSVVSSGDKVESTPTSTKRRSSKRDMTAEQTDAGIGKDSQVKRDGKKGKEPLIEDGHVEIDSQVQGQEKTIVVDDETSTLKSAGKDELDTYEQGQEEEDIQLQDNTNYIKETLQRLKDSKKIKTDNIGSFISAIKKRALGKSKNTIVAKVFDKMYDDHYDKVKSLFDNSLSPETPNDKLFGKITIVYYDGSLQNKYVHSLAVENPIESASSLLKYLQKHDDNFKKACELAKEYHDSSQNENFNKSKKLYMAFVNFGGDIIRYTGKANTVVTRWYHSNSSKFANHAVRAYLSNQRGLTKVLSDTIFGLVDPNDIVVVVFDLGDKLKNSLKEAIVKYHKNAFGHASHILQMQWNAFMCMLNEQSTIYRWDHKYGNTESNWDEFMLDLAESLLILESETLYELNNEHGILLYNNNNENLKPDWKNLLEVIAKNVKFYGFKK